MARKTHFTYGMVDGKPAITGEGGMDIFDANQREFLQQEGMQLNLLNQLHEQVGIPTGLSRLWTTADPAKILPKIAAELNPDNTMLVLKTLPEGTLPGGVGNLLDKIGTGSEDFRKALSSALKNPEFQEQLLQQTGGDQIAEGLALLEDKERLKALGLDDSDIAAVIEKAGTDIFNRIGKGEFNVKFNTLGTEIQSVAIIAAVETKLDKIAAADETTQPVVDLIKSDPTLMRVIGEASMNDETVAAGLTKLISAKGGLNIEELKTAFENPEMRQTFTQALYAVGQSGGDNLEFDRIVDLSEQIKNKQFAEASATLTSLGIEPPASLQAAQTMEVMREQIAEFSKSEAGAGIMSWLREAMGPNGMLGKIFEMLGMGGMREQIAGFFEAPAETNGTTTFEGHFSPEVTGPISGVAKEGFGVSAVDPSDQQRIANAPTANVNGPSQAPALAMGQ